MLTKGLRDMTKLTVDSRNFWKAPINENNEDKTNKSAAQIQQRDNKIKNKYSSVTTKSNTGQHIYNISVFLCNSKLTY
jgi:hypothetical protein